MSPAPASPRPLLRHAETFARAILDARADTALASWAPWIARAQRESAPLITAVRTLARRNLVELPRPGGSPENSTSNGHSTSNGRESAARSGDAGAESVTRSSAAKPEPREVASPMAEPEYLSVAQLARRVPYSPQTIRNLMSRGVLRRDVHYLKPRGRVMFRWSAVRAWLEASRTP